MGSRVLRERAIIPKQKSCAKTLGGARGVQKSFVGDTSILNELSSRQCMLRGAYLIITSTVDCIAMMAEARNTTRKHDNIVSKRAAPGPTQAQPEGKTPPACLAT